MTIAISIKNGNSVQTYYVHNLGIEDFDLFNMLHEMYNNKEAAEKIVNRGYYSLVRDFEKNFRLLNKKPVNHKNLNMLINDISFMEVETFIIYDVEESKWKVVQPYFGIKTPVDLTMFL